MSAYLTELAEAKIELKDPNSSEYCRKESDVYPGGREFYIQILRFLLLDPTLQAWFMKLYVCTHIHSASSIV